MAGGAGLMVLVDTTVWIHLPLLHNDRDFRPMTRYLGLIEVPMTT